MSNAEFINGVNLGVETMDASDVTVTMADLGPGNLGNLGPEMAPADIVERAEHDVTDPEYRRKVNNRWGCVDGRRTRKDLDRVAAGEDVELADGAVGGGLAVSESAAAFMNKKYFGKKHSQLLAESTRRNVAAGNEVVVHGDEHGQEEGCKAHVLERQTLQDNAANMDIVAPKVWYFSQALGLETITQDDVTGGIVEGGKNAENDELWDVTPKQGVEIILENGGVYDELVGEHTEVLTEVDITEDGTLDRARFMKDHDGWSVFVATLGAYKKMAYARASKELAGNPSLDPAEHMRETQLEIMGVIAFNIGICKRLWSQNHRAAVVAKA